MFEFAEPLNAIEGIADADFFDLASANRGFDDAPLTGAVGQERSFPCSPRERPISTGEPHASPAHKPRGSHGKIFQGQGQMHRYTFGVPLMGSLTAELACNNLAGQETTEALMRWLAVKTRAAAFLPGHHEFAAVSGAVDVNASRGRR